MSRALGAPLLTKWARVHGGHGNRIRHAGNYTGMSAAVSKLGAQMKTAPGCANTNRGLDAGKERLMTTILPAWSDSATEARD